MKPQSRYWMGYGAKTTGPSPLRAPRCRPNSEMVQAEYASAFRNSPFTILVAKPSVSSTLTHPREPTLASNRLRTISGDFVLFVHFSQPEPSQDSSRAWVRPEHGFV